MNKFKLGEIADLSIGFVGTVTTQYEEDGIPFLRTLNIKPYEIISDDLKTISATFHESQKKSQLFEGDIAMVHTGVPGICCVIPKEYDNSNCIDMIVIKPNREMVNPVYLEGYMNIIGVKHIANQQVGAIQKHFNLSDAVDFELFLPDLAEQNKIADLLSSITNTIKTNRSINDNLQQMIETKYGYYFLQDTCDDMEEKTITALADLYQPKTIGGDELDDRGRYYVYGANGIIGKYDKYNHEEPTIAIACRGASCGELQMTLPFSWITGNAMVVMPNVDFPYKEFLFYTMMWNKPKRLVSGSAQPQITRDNLSLYKVAIPSKKQLDYFEDEAKSVRKLIIKNMIENQRLAELRDWLLPMLMNGQAIIED